MVAGFAEAFFTATVVGFAEALFTAIVPGFAEKGPDFAVEEACVFAVLWVLLFAVTTGLCVAEMLLLAAAAGFAAFAGVAVFETCVFADCTLTAAGLVAGWADDGVAGVCANEAADNRMTIPRFRIIRSCLWPTIAPPLDCHG